MTDDLSSRLQRWEEALMSTGLEQRLGIRRVRPHSLDWSPAERRGVHLSLLPLHTVHPVLSGNKWFKLKYHLVDALAEPGRPLLSFGGPWSNHLHALAWAGRCLGLETHGVIGADEGVSTPTLEDLRQFGMRLHFVGRTGLRAARAAGFPDDRVPGAHCIPEGGFDERGWLGCASLGLGDLGPVDVIHLACGTGCTLAGLRMGVSPGVRVCGWNTHRGDWLAHQVSAWLREHGGDPGAWTVRTSVGAEHFGPVGLPEGEWPDIPFDPVYLPRVMTGLADLLNRGDFRPGERWLVVHGGGLQGARPAGAETG